MSYRSTIARQPEAIHDTCLSIEGELAGLGLKRVDLGVIGLTGIGASLAAARIGAAELQRLGRRGIAFYPGELTSGAKPTDVLIGLSHRGRSVETVEAFTENRKAVRLAFTSDAESPLAKAADIHLRLVPGGDSTPSATGYTTTLAAMGLVIERMAGVQTSDWAALSDAAAKVLDDASCVMDRASVLFVGRRAIDCIASATAFGTADETALLVREAARIPAAGFETRDYLHGPMESMDGTTGAVVFGAQRELKLAADLDSIGVPTLLVTSASDAPEGRNLAVVKVPACESVSAQAILDILAPQLLAASLSDALGLTDTQFRYRQRDTKIA